MCIVLRGQDSIIEQARRQLEDLVPVWAVLDYTRTKTIERELLLAKISILGPEYFEDQLAFKIEESRHARGYHQPSTIDEGSPASDRIAMTRQSAQPHDTFKSTRIGPGARVAPPYESLSPSEALRQKHTHLLSLQTIVSQFQGKIVDVSHDSIVVEVTGKTGRIDAFLKLTRPYGILEAARSGAMVMPRAPIESEWVGLDDMERVEESEAVDASLLPPG